jgi:hypothetical protein
MVNIYTFKNPTIFCHQISTFALQCHQSERAKEIWLQLATFPLLTPDILSPYFVSHFQCRFGSTLLHAPLCALLLFHNVFVENVFYEVKALYVL